MKRILLAAGVALWMVAGSVAAKAPSDLDLPQIGEPADNSLSPAQERALGLGVMGQLYRAGYVLDDPELTDYISTIGWKLAANSKTRPPHLTFFVVNDPRVNAFALPGGFIGINAGLLLAAGNESEVAGVMGHELAHVTQRHIARTAEDTGPANAATWLAVIAAIIAGSANPEVIIGALSLGQAMNYQRQVSYTRAHEEEADRIGIQTMARAGYDPHGMASFFQKIEQQSRLYGSSVPDILRTHPLSSKRIAEAETRADEMKVNLLPQSMQFGLMRARARVLSADRPSTALADFATEEQAGRDTPENRYGMALGYQAVGQSAQAMKTLQPLLDAHPKQPNLHLLAGRLQIETGHTKEGLKTFDAMLGLYPRYAPAILADAEGLMDAGDPQAARTVLLGHEQALGMQSGTYNLLAQAARESGNLPEASYQMASYHFLRGDPGLALAQLDAGLRLPNLDEKQRARLLAKRKEVRAALPEHWRPEDDRDGGRIGVGD